MKLYYDPITVNCRKVLAGLDLIGADYESVVLNYFAGEFKQPEYTAINPTVSVPFMTEGDLTLWESNAILLYAAEKMGNPQVWPADAASRGDIAKWLLWESNTWFQACYTYLVENVVKPILDDKPDTAMLEEYAPTWHRHASVLEGGLQGRDWLVAGQTTIADIAVAAPMHLHAAQKLPLENYPNIRGWMSRVEALPCWHKSDPIPHIPQELLAKLS